jgi:uncharacterized protein YndB with AHSA1/START domain
VADDATIERTIRIEAPPEAVFRCLIDPDLMPQWMGIGAEVDPRPGGIYRCAMVPQGIFVRGEFIAVERPHRVVFTWGWEGFDRLVPPGSTVVEFTLRPDRGATLLTLRHSGLPAGHEEFHGMGWQHYLPRLAEIAAGRDPGPDRMDRALVAAMVAALPPPGGN